MSSHKAILLGSIGLGLILTALSGLYQTVNKTLNQTKPAAKPIVNEHMTLMSSNHGIDVWKFTDPRTDTQYLVVKNGAIVRILFVPKPDVFEASDF